MKVSHSPACERLLAEWRTHPADSVEHRLAVFAGDHSDAEVRDLLITVFDEDHGTPAEVFAAQLWPTLTGAVADARSIAIEHGWAVTDMTGADGVDGSVSVMQRHGVVVVAFWGVDGVRWAHRWPPGESVQYVDDVAGLVAWLTEAVTA
ncbi:hypothetical protein [Nocardia farcinica]|uniref:hypothetical protein n=1 Tax=Nocardia farcinica TaxID=37329 RepID=UPI0024571E58|nr:hypothetical protein [Nocardia farcinica]